MKRKFNYFYQVINKVNGNFYYGVHKTDNLNDGYLGSGKRLGYAIKKYSEENFEKEILEFFDTYEKALDFESEIVTEELILDSSCYNIALGGLSDIGFLRQGPSLRNKITKKIINPKNIEEYHKLWSTNKYEGISKGKCVYKGKNGKKYSLFKNDPLIKELNLINNFKNRIHCRDKNNNFYIVESNDPRYLNGELRKGGAFEGKKLSLEHKRKIGKKNAIHQKGKGNSQYGTCWIYNKILRQNKKIKKEELGKIEKNWIKGRKFFLESKA